MCTHRPPFEYQLLVKSILRNKAVADGAVSFCIDHYVTARVSKFAFGTDCIDYYDANNPEHTSRSHMKFIDLSGDVMLRGLFTTILPLVALLFDVMLSY